MTKVVHWTEEDVFVWTPEQLKEMHDLIASIQQRQYEQEDDIANLQNLFHVCLGTGVRGERWMK